MRRNPLYVFKDRQSLGIQEVPLKSIIQIIDTGIPGDPVQDPKIVQIISDAGLTSGSTIGDF
jgi:hypothetical protein